MEKLSEAAKKKLEEETLANISEYVNLVNVVRRSIKTIDQVDNILKENGSSASDENGNLRRLSEYTILLCLIWLDITTAFRIYINAKENYEVLYSVKQLVITINEGFKKIYNYISFAKDGSPKTGERNKSFWVKDIGILVNKEIPELLPKYNEITKHLNDYDDQELHNMQVPRSLFVHYDDEPSKVYDKLIEQDIEKMSIKTLPFMTIISEMILFCKVVLGAYNSVIQKRKDNFFDEQYQVLEKMKTQFESDPKAMELFSFIQNDLLDFGKK